jgi:hypothetical protein
MIPLHPRDWPEPNPRENIRARNSRLEELRSLIATSFHKGDSFAEALRSLNFSDQLIRNRERVLMRACLH